MSNFNQKASYVQQKGVSQSEGLVPRGVEGAFDGLCLLLALTLGIGNQLELDVGV